MNANDFVGGGYLRSADIPPGGKALVASHVTAENLEDKSGKSKKKLVLWFASEIKGLVLNSTNIDFMQKYSGTSETDRWQGYPVVLVVHQTPMGPGILLQAPSAQVGQRAAVAPIQTLGAQAPAYCHTPDVERMGEL